MAIFADVITCETDMSRAGKQLMSANCMIRREIVRKVQYGLSLIVFSKQLSFDMSSGLRCL